MAVLYVFKFWKCRHVGIKCLKNNMPEANKYKADYFNHAGHIRHFIISYIYLTSRHTKYLCGNCIPSSRYNKQQTDCIKFQLIPGNTRNTRVKEFPSSQYNQMMNVVVSCFRVFIVLVFH